jgi:hypothetical protein
VARVVEALVAVDTTLAVRRHALATRTAARASRRKRKWLVGDRVAGNVFS